MPGNGRYRAPMTARRRLVLVAAAVLAVALAAGLAWFQPWKLFVDERVDEALPPVATRSIASTPTPSGDPVSSAPVRSTTAAPSTSSSREAR